MRKFLLTVTIASLFACSKPANQQAEKIFHFECIDNVDGDSFSFDSPEVIKNTTFDPVNGRCFSVPDAAGLQRKICSKATNVHCEKYVKE